MYITRPCTTGEAGVINPRRGAVSTVPLLSWKAAAEVQDDLFAVFGLDDYIGCVTGEMSKRPIPHVFEESQTSSLTSLFREYEPQTLERVLSLMGAPIQPFNKTSRLGWPFFTRPESKLAALRPAFARLEEVGADEALDTAFIIMNVRLQPESKRKERAFLFVDDAGKVEEETVSGEQRAVRTPAGERTGSRTRLVFNFPFANLYKQVLDTAMHNVLLSYPAFHHNMYGPPTLPAGMAVLAFDVKHFERFTALCARERGALIGGLYGDITAAFTEMPFLCPSRTWRSAWWLWPDRARGYSEQYGSGDSAVAPVQKEIFIALYRRFAEDHLGVPQHASLDWMVGGGDHRLRILNYGDDNFVAGDPSVLKDVFAFMGDYLHVEEEDPAKFLGFLWFENTWRLGQSSYLLKTYLNERAPYTPFRKYPLYGWTEKRKVYTEYGVPDIVGKVFPEENKMLEDHGVPWSRVLMGAQEEAMVASAKAGAFRKPAWLLDKDYMLTAEEKLASGLWEGLYPHETAPMLSKLVGHNWRTKFA